MAALAAAAAANTKTYPADSPRVAFLGFALINTSLEPTKPEEEARLRMLEGLLKEKLDASGRFMLVRIPPDLQQEIARGPEIRD
jgi:hypothetical protein